MINRGIHAQKELSKLPVYQRVYQSLRTGRWASCPADFNLRDQVGPTFDNVFICRMIKNWLFRSFLPVMDCKAIL